MATLGKLGLVEENQGQIAEAPCIALRLQTLHQQVIQIHFKGRLGRGGILAHGLENPRQVSAHIVLTHHDSSGGIDQPSARPHGVNPVTKGVLKTLEEISMLLRRLLALFLLLLVG